MNTSTSSQPHTLVALYSTPEVNRITDFASTTARLSVEELVIQYTDLRDTAPCRHHRKKRYFEGRHGITGSGQQSNRREEHLAVALRNAFSRDRPTQLDNGQTLTLLDYQTPLKARRDNKGIGKVDLFGVIDGTLPCVIELKVPTTNGGVSDTPLRAFLEALAYCAVIEANSADISAEAAASFGMQLTRGRPCVSWHLMVTGSPILNIQKRGHGGHNSKSWPQNLRRHSDWSPTSLPCRTPTSKWDCPVSHPG